MDNFEDVENRENQGEPAKLARHRFTNEEIEEWRQSHGGILYFNSSDSRVMVPKRSGLGASPNFANPLGWLALLLIVGLIVGIRFLIVGIAGK